MTTLFKADVRTDVIDNIRKTLVPDAERMLFLSWYDQDYASHFRGQLVMAFDIGMELGRISVNPDYLQKLAKANVAPIYRAVRGQAQYVEDVNLAAEFYAQDRAGELLAGVTDTQTAAVNDIVSTGLRRGWTNETLTKQLSRVIGLNPRMAGAVDKFRQSLLDQGVLQGFADSRADEYAKQLAWNRARTVASTETQRAINAGQRSVWKTYQQLDELPQSAQVQWVLHPTEKTCAVCRDMAGSVYELDASDHPPTHPNCKCTERLVYNSGVVISKHLENVASFGVHAHGPGGTYGGHDQQLHGVWAWDNCDPGKTANDTDINDVPASEHGAFASRKQVLAYRQKISAKTLKMPEIKAARVHEYGYSSRRKTKYHTGNPRGKPSNATDFTRLVDKVRPEQTASGTEDAFDVYTGLKLTLKAGGSKGSLSLDRIIPGKHGGEYIPGNIVICHTSANSKRGAKQYPFARPKWYTDEWIGRANKLNKNGQDLCDAYYAAHDGNPKDSKYEAAVAWARRTGRTDLIPAPGNKV